MSSVELRRVLFLAPSAYPLGGVAVWLEYLCPGLAALGLNPVVGLVQGKAHDVENYRRAYPGLKTIAIGNPTGSAEGRRRAVVRAIDQVQPDLVVGVNIADTYPAIRRMRAQGKVTPRVAMSLHGIESDLLSDLRANSDVVDAVISSNRLACRLCELEAGVAPSRIFYAPYGVDQSALGTLAQVRPSDSRLRIAWVGRLEQDQKQVHELPAILQACDSLGLSYVLRIAGDGPERDSVLRKLAPWIESGSVQWLGALPVSRVPSEVYACSDVLLLTSTWETGPIVIWEAMAAGTCVVTSRYVGSGLEAALTNKQNCLMFVPGDSMAAAQQLARAQSASLRAELTAAARDLITERYSREHSIRSWASAFAAIMHLPRTDALPELPPPPSGRLDRWLGTGTGESVRAILGIAHAATSPGDEWPHTHSPLGRRDELLARAKSLDCP